jgi:hypothetical protein
MLCLYKELDGCGVWLEFSERQNDIECQSMGLQLEKCCV